MGLKELVDISRRYGADNRFVLAGGGNTSFKDEKTLYVKASGTTLAELTEAGLAKMDRRRLGAIWERRYSADTDEREREALADLMAARVEGESKRPSVETLLHDLLDQSHVVHLHPTLVNGLTCGQEGEAAAHELFPEAMLWIPVVNPGYVLAKHIREMIADHLAKGRSYPVILFLENHGVFVAGDSTEEIDRVYGDIMTKLTARLKRAPELDSLRPAPGEISREAAEHITEVIGAHSEEGAVELRGIAGPEALHATASQASFEPFHSFGYTPDHLVYCKAEPIWVPAGSESSRVFIEGEVERFARRYKALPRIFAIEGKGAIAAGDSRSVADSAADLFEDLVALVGYAESFGGPKLMPEDKIEFILNWEVESYRAKVSRDGE